MIRRRSQLAASPGVQLSGCSFNIKAERLLGR
jgi:hypothetical protein